MGGKVWWIERKDGKDFYHKYGGVIKKTTFFVCSVPLPRVKVYLKRWLKLNPSLTFEDFVIKDITDKWGLASVGRK